MQPYGPGYGPPQQPYGQGYGAPPQPYGPPAMGFVGQPNYGAPAFVLGDQLEVPVRGAALPPVCAKCGGTHDLRGRAEAFVYVPPVAYVGLLAGLLIGAILITIMQKKAHVTVPLCGACEHRWKWARRSWGLSIGLPFLLLLLGFALAIALSPGDAAGAAFGISFLLFMVAIVVGPILVHFLLVKKRTLTVAFADDFRARLRGAAPEHLAAVTQTMQLGTTPHFQLPQRF